MAETARPTATRVQTRYEGDATRPLQGYLVTSGAFVVAAASLVAWGKARGVRLPERFSLGDTVLLSLATHKASRLLAKDAVTSPVRAPFAKYEEPAGAAEVNESVRGHGIRHAIGELVTCPFCLAVWVSSGLVAGMVFAPRATRIATTILTVVAASDGLQLAYDAGKQMAHRAGDGP